MPVERRALLAHALRHGPIVEDGAKHGKIRDPASGVVFPYPRGSSSRELGDAYLRGYCRAFGFDIHRVREEL